MQRKPKLTPEKTEGKAVRKKSPHLKDKKEPELPVSSHGLKQKGVVITLKDACADMVDDTDTVFDRY